ncbi:MAG: hypothetical protein EAX95_07370 [Candidatus Thorarchaeota archaeon]|nr:hypothetical protein [Candidatus Thorarchaeota archaeon]
MAYLEGITIGQGKIALFLEGKIRTKGILKKEPIEELRISSFYWRPFRIVEWITSEGQGSNASVVDESLAIPELESNEDLLLWRPNYASIAATKGDGLKEEASDSDGLLQLIQNLVQKRLDAQERLAELEPEVRRIQADRRAAAGVLLPRTPGGLRKDAAVMERRQPDHGLLLATSIVMNVPNSVMVKDFTLGERVYVGTVSAVFIDNESSEERDLHLESPGAASLSAALKNASGLTRICSINGNCRALVRQQAQI